MAPVALQPRGLTSQTHWPPDIDKENEQVNATPTKKNKGHTPTEQDVDAFNENKVPEYHMEENNDQLSNVAEKENQNPENTTEIYNSTSGPELVMQGIQVLPSLSDINAQFFNHVAYWDYATPSQQKPSLAMKQCPHPSHFGRHNRNQHGFTFSARNATVACCLPRDVM